MTDPIDPIDPARGVGPVSPVGERRAGDRRVQERRENERRSNAKAPRGKANLPVVTATPKAAKPTPDPDPQAAAAAAAFAAQLLGQRGQKRGLKGGPPVLKSARAAYLEAEWSGPSDRRVPVGKITKTET